MEIVEQLLTILAYIAVIGFLISGLDDLFFDSHFLVYLFRNRGKKPISIDQLKSEPEQWAAIFVPAWREGGIVNRMADYASRVLHYEKYDIFVGVYPNDPETIACLDEVCARNPRVHKVVVPHPGPTSKADCLNWIYRAMRLNEVPGTREYKLIALHDAEDVLHPLLLKVYNYFVPKQYDMGQVPVFALEHPALTFWSANTYIDDFSELHTKDLFVRESIGGVVPSAGVGTCFTRKAIDKLAAEDEDLPFHTGNLTEDYEVGIRLKRAGFRTGVINVPVERIARKRKRDGTYGPPKTVTEVVAVREAFPCTFWSAVRQRTRWILGISFQTWEQAGWRGNLAMRYTLLRDRRAPLTHLLNMAGYLTLAAVLLQWIFSHTPWAERLYFKPVLTSDSFLWKIVIVDTWLLAYRAAQKWISVKTVYNARQAFLSIPRVVVGNMINFVATVRALSIYVASKLFRRPIVWHKTAHVFPGESELREYSKTIEDLLVEQGLVTREQVFQALEQQRSGSAPLCLMRMGLLDEAEFSDVWSRYSGLPVRFLDPDTIDPGLLKEFPESQSLEWQAIPVERVQNHLVFAFREPPSPGQLKLLGRRTGCAVEPVLARPSGLSFTRDRVYPNQVLGPVREGTTCELWGRTAGLDAAGLRACREDQQTTWKPFLEILVDRGALDPNLARDLWAAHLGLMPSTAGQPELDQDRFYSVGPFFWLLHRLLPLSDNTILAGAKPHPKLVAYLNEKLGRVPEFRAALPSRVEQTARNLGAWVDPDRALVDCLVGKRLLTLNDVKRWEAATGLVKDSAYRWLQLEKRVRRSQLRATFIEICGLPQTEASPPDRLKAALPPGHADEHQIHVLDDEGGVTLGLGAWPGHGEWRYLRHRFEGRPVFFQCRMTNDE